ncbi:MAG TPA: hypothetical protein PLQ83_18970 [Thermoflexales bacterium]|nr:hypothetical protein [Thermoflexales bacterium]
MTNRKFLLGFALLVACALGPGAPDRDCVTRDLVIGLEAFPPGGNSTSVNRSSAPIVDNAYRGVYYVEGPTTYKVARFPNANGAKRDFEQRKEHDLGWPRSESLAPKATVYRSGVADQQYLLCDEGLCIYFARYQEYTTMVAANMGPNMTGEALNKVIMEVDRKMTECLAKPVLK